MNYITMEIGDVITEGGRAISTLERFGWRALDVSCLPDGGVCFEQTHSLPSADEFVVGGRYTLVPFAQGGGRIIDAKHFARIYQRDRPAIRVGHLAPKGYVAIDPRIIYVIPGELAEFVLFTEIFFEPEMLVVSGYENTELPYPSQAGIPYQFAGEIFESLFKVMEWLEYGFRLAADGISYNPIIRAYFDGRIARGTALTVKI